MEITIKGRTFRVENTNEAGIPYKLVGKRGSFYHLMRLSAIKDGRLVGTDQLMALDANAMPAFGSLRFFDSNGALVAQ
jgi:hypothetical protein